MDYEAAIDREYYAWEDFWAADEEWYAADNELWEAQFDQANSFTN